MNTIIQCPACNTKFALNASQLAGIDSPKFHCSRCNTIFSPESPDTKIEENQESLLEDSDLYSESKAESNYFNTTEKDSLSDPESEEIFENQIPEDEELIDEEDIPISRYSLEMTNNASDIATANDNIEPIEKILPTESQLSLNYEHADDTSTIEDMSIDWPDNDGARSLVSLESRYGI